MSTRWERSARLWCRVVSSRESCAYQSVQDRNPAQLRLCTNQRVTRIYQKLSYASSNWSIHNCGEMRRSLQNPQLFRGIKTSSKLSRLDYMRDNTTESAQDHWSYCTWDHHVRHISTRSNKTNSNTSFDLSEEQRSNISLHCTASVFLFPSCPTSCFYLSFYRNTHAALICMYCWSFATQLDREAKVKLNSLMPFIDEWKQHILLIHPKMMYINLRAPHNAAWPFSITKVTKKGKKFEMLIFPTLWLQTNRQLLQTVLVNWLIFFYI